jgi:hypothetical protein
MFTDSITSALISPTASTDNWYFSKYQPYSAAYNDYQACKAQAPKGFDCMMVPLMVSEEYIKGQSHD